MNPSYRSISVLLLSFALLIPGASAQPAQELLGPEDGVTGFAYDPQKEEGSHDDALLEWWYHFAFLKEKGSDEYQYSLISSFQRWRRPNLMKIMFYCLVDLKTGEKFHYGSMQQIPGMKEAMLPEGHKFFPVEGSDCGPAESVIWECYGDNSIKKQKDGTYDMSYKNADFSMDVTLTNQGPPLPVNGNGLQGMVERTDQHYYTYPRMSGDVTITRPSGKTELIGDFWYDHQWATPKHQKSMRWVFMGLKLENGENLSLFVLRNSKTDARELWGFTRHYPDGKTDFHKDVTFTAKKEWVSPTKKIYDTHWLVEVPSAGMTVTVEAWGDDHELANLGGSHLWEGPCKVTATYKDGSKSKGVGYLEMQSRGRAE